MGAPPSFRHDGRGEARKIAALIFHGSLRWLITGFFRPVAIASGHASCKGRLIITLMAACVRYHLDAAFRFDRKVDAAIFGRHAPHLRAAFRPSCAATLISRARWRAVSASLAIQQLISCCARLLPSRCKHTYREYYFRREFSFGIAACAGHKVLLALT